ncbi:hypothetical protein GV828_02170 [Flavobacterium sp. NST-5]|uniref:Lipoprotein n=1 Tax=Flavobacterium ichthyis TaxID=2698827 RepID=A0ABW9Z710_9FLAO|nr:hypothetical protein [Flavobacterium ichthyis]NBL64001.1 hypothetical protein [Flavobacterium ichthyis]
MNDKLKSSLRYLSLLVIFTSCNSTFKLSELKNDKGNIFAHHFSYDASKRGSLVYEKDGKLAIISEPPPDVATKLATDLGANVKAGSEVDVSAYLSTTKAIAELGKRTASVNMLRDALYKLSEMSMSNNINDNTAALFGQILKAIENMHKVEMEQSKKEAVEAEVNVAEAKAKEAQAKVNELLLMGTFEQNENLGAKANYQNAIQLLLDEKLDDAKTYFEALYKKYPVHFNIEEINKKLKDYNSNEMSAGKWKEIYQFLRDNPWGIETEHLRKIKNKL